MRAKHTPEMKRASAALLAIAIIGVAGCARGPDPGRLEAQLRHDLPIGTPSAQIDAYLTAHGWMHDYLPKERAWLAGVRNVGQRLSFTREDIAIKIDLDRNKCLKSISVTPLFTYHGR
jgi:hypothetical protein